MRRFSSLTWTVGAGCLFVALLVAIPARAQDWAGNGRIQGQVTDSDKKPIAGATVTLKLNGAGPEPIITDKKGRWAKLGLATGDWEITIQAEGFKTGEGSQHVVSGAVGAGPNVRVSLNRFSEEEVKAAHAEANKGPDIKGMIEAANAALMKSQWAEARADYEKALALIEDPSVQVSIYRSIASTHFGEGDTAAATQTLEKGLAIQPDDQDSLKLITTILSAAGKDDEADRYRAKITGDFKLDPATLLNRGIEQYNKGNYEAALGHFNQTVAENPGYADAYYFRGLAFLATGKAAEAKADFQKLLELAPGHAKAAEVKEFIANL